MKTSSNKKITVLIPCYNEENGIGAVIKGFPTNELASQGYDLEVLVIDNNSTDRTTEVASMSGARVIHEHRKGKGNAVRRGFYSISKDTDYVVMLDGDNTYRSDEILRLVEPLNADFCNVVIGSRLTGNISENSMKSLNWFGNMMYSKLVTYFYGTHVTDVLTGYFAWKRKTIETLRPHLESEDFRIEMEMVTKMARLGEKIRSVPISYDVREGTSNLRPIYDGLRILLTFAQNLTWNPILKHGHKGNDHFFVDSLSSKSGRMVLDQNN